MNLPKKDQFELYANDDFHISFLENNSLPCQIEEVKAGVTPSDTNFSEQFSVIFACDKPEVFEQGVYQVSHTKLGQFDLFLVPVFGDDKGVHYEAVFT